MRYLNSREKKIIRKFLLIALVAVGTPFLINEALVAPHKFATNHLVKPNMRVMPINEGIRVRVGRYDYFLPYARIDGWQMNKVEVFE